MKEVIDLKLQIFLLLRLLSAAVPSHLVMRTLNQSEVGVPVEEIVFLEKNGIGLLLVLGEVADGLYVSILEVLLLELGQDNVLLSELSVADHKDLQVFLNFIRGLGLYLAGYGLDVSKVMLSDTFDKSLILFDSPLEESSLRKFTEPLLVLLRDNLVVILSSLNLLAKSLKFLKVIIELKLVDLGNLDGAVLLLHRLLFFSVTLCRLLFEVMNILANEIVLHRVVKAVVQHGSLALLATLN